MAHFIDRRLNGRNKSAVNRQRFIRRYQQQLKKAVSDAVLKRSIQDIDNGESVSIPTRDISEPIFHQGKGGLREQVHPGNDQFIAGDKIDRPLGGGSGGSGSGDASNQGEGQDDFHFDISKDEYLDLLFDGLELPNLEKNKLNKINEMKTFRAGYSAAGVPANINIVRSLRQSLARRMALQVGKRKTVAELERELLELGRHPSRNFARIQELELEIIELKRRIAAVPFIDTFDLRFNNFVQRPVPSTQAVMFCLMDVSGSMDQATKDMAKRFYLLLYMFLTRTYKNVEVVFIRHHTQAKEVDEQEFFYSQETGGTIVSSALRLMKEVIDDRYPPQQWNIYAAQASDGDNWADDSPLCKKLLGDDLLSMLRYYAYIEITNRAHQSLWQEYEVLAQDFPNFAMEHIRTVDDIYPVFRELFKKQAVRGAHD
ncbi:YeaH/YhbH family protein [Oceanisphaera sp. IT1-181]|uniref:YeaH/YhbH family protein n=1 Tax=Oceanisphaera sp. IT1-181 TaxID=3081199 RepID=UPI0029CA63AB|nr:YeaH/YhbH family protein [Oceanisphaera sp. IT1-181]